MTHKLFKFIIFFTVMVSAVSCKKFLNVVPDNIGTIEYAFRMRTEAEKYLFTCYNNLPNFAEVNSNPAFLAGGEMMAPDINIYTQGRFPAIRVFKGEQNTTNPYFNYWDGTNGGKAMFIAIRECNIFLENINSVPDITAEEKKRWVAEVKFLKAFYHFYLFKNYGPIPVTDVNLPAAASIEEVRVSRQPVDSVVNYIVKTIDEALPDLPATILNLTSEEGRVSKTIALSVKAQVLLTAASPLFNGNTDYANLKNKDGKQLFNQTFEAGKWSRAATACKEAVDAAGAAGHLLFRFPVSTIAGLSDTVRTLLSVNGAISDKFTNKEGIWRLTSFIGSTSTYQRLAQARLTPTAGVFPEIPGTNESIWSTLAPPISVAGLFYSKNGVPISEDNSYNYAGRFTQLRTATEAQKYLIRNNYTTVQLHFDREPRFYANLGFDGGQWFGFGVTDQNTQWYLEGLAGKAGARRSADLYSVTGYWPKKVVSYLNDFGSNSGSYNVNSYPWPYIRLSELFLMYAEALNEASGPSAEVYKWIDTVRSRAGLNGVVQSWANFSSNPGKPATKDGLRQIIQQEKLIETIFEGKNYWDMLRWKRGVELTGPVEGWDLEQSNAANYYRKRTLFNVLYSPKMYFSPLMDNTLLVNPNLVQNFGW